MLFFLIYQIFLFFLYFINILVVCVQYVLIFSHSDKKEFISDKIKSLLPILFQKSTYQSNHHFQNTSTIWFHAVSGGEVILVKQIIDYLNQKNLIQGIHIYITTSTYTGYSLLKNFSFDQKFISYNVFPMDFYPLFHKVFNRFSIRLLIIMKYNQIMLWLKLIHYHAFETKLKFLFFLSRMKMSI